MKTFVYIGTTAATTKRTIWKWQVDDNEFTSWNRARGCCVRLAGRQQCVSGDKFKEINSTKSVRMWKKHIHTLTRSKHRINNQNETHQKKGNPLTRNQKPKWNQHHFLGIKMLSMWVVFPNDVIVWKLVRSSLVGRLFVRSFLHWLVLSFARLLVWRQDTPATHFSLPTKCQHLLTIPIEM